MSYLEMKNITKQYDHKNVLKNVSLTIEKGTLTTLLGPSGCGKSTLLRCLSGLETLTSGEIFIDGVAVTHLPPAKRKIGMVFQHYSLFPHMDVYANIAFPLKQQKKSKAFIEEKVMKMLALVGLEERKEAYPNELSGGQQQRVALARALVQEPQVLLLDEPLSAIDAKLRKSLQEKIRTIQQTLGITTIFVTHDQDEAMIMSDQIYLLNNGDIEQRGDPVDLYTHPRTLFSAQFIGNYNVLDKAQWHTLFPDFSIKTTHVAIRPETIHLSEQKEGAIGSLIMQGKVINHVSHGNVLRYEVQINEQIHFFVDVLFRSFHLYDNGETLYLSIEKHNVIEVNTHAEL